MARTETDGRPAPRVNGLASTAAAVDTAAGNGSAELTGTGSESESTGTGGGLAGGITFEDPAGTGTGSGDQQQQPGQQQRKGPGGWNRGKRRINGRWVSDTSSSTGSSSTGPGQAGPGQAGPGQGSSSGKRKAQASVQTSLEGIEGILLSAHMMLASFTQIRELELAEDEAAKLSAAIARVAALYDVGASEKTLAWTNLMVCMGGIYGTRAFAFKLRKDAEEQAKKAPRLVTPFAGQAHTQQQPVTAANGL